MRSTNSPIFLILNPLNPKKINTNKGNRIFSFLEKWKSKKLKLWESWSQLDNNKFKFVFRVLMISLDQSKLEWKLHF